MSEQEWLDGWAERELAEASYVEDDEWYQEVDDLLFEMTKVILMHLDFKNPEKSWTRDAPVEWYA